MVNTTLHYIKQHLGNRLYLNSYLLMLMRLIGPAGGFFFWAIAARSVASAELGLGSAVITSAALLAGLAQLGTGYALVRFLPNSAKPTRLLSLSVESVAASGIVLSLVYVAGLSIWSPELLNLRRSWPAIASYVLLVTLYGLFQQLNWFFLARRKPAFSLLKNAIQSLASVLLLVAFAHALNDYRAPVLSYILSIAVGLLVSYAVFVPIVDPRSRLQLVAPILKWSEVKRYAIVNYLADQIQRAPDTIIPLLIVNSLGAGIGAYFFVAWAIAAGLRALTGAISPSLFAEGANKPSIASEYARKSLIFGLVVAVSAAAVVVIGGRFALLLYGEEYATNAYAVLVILGIAIVPNSVYPIYLSVLRITDQLRKLIFLAGFSLVTGLALTYLGGSAYGLVGAGAGWLASRILVLLGTLILWRQERSTAIVARSPTQTSVALGKNLQETAE